MTDFDRRTFLKGLLGVTAVAVVAAPELAKAKDDFHTFEHDGFDYELPKKSGRFDDFTGTVYMDGNVVPGDQIIIQYSHDPANNGIYEVTAVHNGREVSIARVHEGDEVRMPMDEVEPYLNRELRRHHRRRVTTSSGPSRPVVPTRPRKTWPSPRRSRRR